METLKSVKADLENKKFVYREIGLIAALLIVFLAFNIKSYDKQTIDLDYGPNTEVAEEIIPVTVQETKKLPPPQPVQTVKISIVDDDVEVESDIVIDAEVTQETIIEEFVPYVPIEEEEEEVLEEEPIFVVVESMPEFPGGNVELMKFLHSKIKYPSLAKEAGIQGRVFVSFVIEIDGSVSNIKILRGIGGGCDEEAIRVVQSMPKWKPGTQRNNPVRVRFNLPLKFTLQN